MTDITWMILWFLFVNMIHYILSIIKKPMLPILSFLVHNTLIFFNILINLTVLFTRDFFNILIYPIFSN